jgi:DNA repair exonuclease SbcCD ATPase subunit
MAARAQDSLEGADYEEMAAQPISLVEDPRDVALTDLARELETQRSAGRAVLATCKELDAQLAKARAALLEAQQENGQLAVAAEHHEEELKQARVMNFSLYSELQDARSAFERERSKPAWRRLLKR